MTLERYKELMARLMCLLAQSATDDRISRTIINRFEEFAVDPMSVPVEWRSLLADLIRDCEETRNSPDFQIPRLPRDPHIKPKDDEAFRLFSDEFYDVK